MWVYSEKITPRLRYAIRLFFREILGMSGVNLTDDWEAFQQSEGPRLIYGRNKLEGVPSLYPVNLLFEEDIAAQHISISRDENGIPRFFATSADQSLLPFDPLAAGFYLVSRYEEYLPGQRDIHDRYMPEESLAFREGFLDLPVVNHWARMLGAALRAMDPGWEGTPRKYSYLSTIDIDNLYAYCGKGGFRTLGGFAKDFGELRFSNARQRLLCILGLKGDPYDTFDLQRKLAEKYGADAMYFVLFSEFGEFDRNIPMYSRVLHESVRMINDYYPVGIHPSYGSHQSIRILEREVRGLREALHVPVRHSRQHFLKMSIPQTFRNLVELEITDDYSMGYAGQLGFRAGICTPFTFYDLETESEMPLTMHPFSIMDGALIYYQEVEWEEAFERMKPIVDAVRAVDGEMISIWHNRIFSEAAPEWRGWNRVYENLLEYAKP